MHFKVVSDNTSVFTHTLPTLNQLDWQPTSVDRLYSTVITTEQYDLISSFFWETCYEQRISVGFVPVDNKFRAVFFDLDGTIIRSESIVELAKTINAHKEIEKLTTQAMVGEVGYEESFRQRMRLLQRVRKESISELSLPLHKGIEETLLALRAAGIKFFLISSAIYPFVKRIGEILCFDDYQGNRVRYIGQQLVVDEKSDIIDSRGKRRWVERKCSELGIESSAVVTVGDGANDIEMMRYARLAVGFMPQRVMLGSINALNFSADHQFLLPLILDY